MMKFVAAMIVVAGMMLAGCGSGSNGNGGNVNGNWTAALTDSNNNPVFDFTTSLSENTSNGALTVSNFSFTTNDPNCSITQGTETGSFVLSGNFSGNVSGKFLFTATSGNGNNAALNLTGTVNGGSISGSWVLAGTGSGCTGSGTFTMTKA